MSEPGLGLTAFARRVSDLGLGAAALALQASAGAIERFVPPGAGEPGPGASGPAADMVRALPGALLGVALALQRSTLEVAAAVETYAASAANALARRPALRVPIAATEGYLESWRERARVEQARREALLADFVRALVPVVVEGVVTRLDVNGLLDLLPLDDVLERVDLDALLARVDIGALLDRIDVGAIVSRVDVDAIVGRVDVDAIVSRVDVDAIVGRVDINAILDDVDLGGIIRESTGSVTSDIVDGARITAMRLDGFVARVADRVLFRRRPRDVEVPRPAWPELMS